MKDLVIKCVVTKESDRCVRCNEKNQKCDLAPPGKEYEKAQGRVDSLTDEILLAEAKVARLRKQRRQELRKLKEMGDQESRNILELEEDERIEAEQSV